MSAAEMRKSKLLTPISPTILAQVRKAVDVMRSGGCAAFPTDTVYGLGADVYNAEAVTRVFTVKRRLMTLPMPVLIAETKQLGELTGAVSDTARVLMDKFWPGGLTIVFNRKASFDSPVLAGSGKVAVRLPGHAVTLRLIQELGSPMVGTSANLHNGPSALTASDVKRQLGDNVDFIIDGGPCPGGIESTLVDITVDPPTILRVGAIPAGELTALLQI